LTKNAEIICKCGKSFKLFEDWEKHMIDVHGSRREDLHR
jgi:hypothetical protein